MADDLTKRLQNILDELKAIMVERHARIEDLRVEIAEMEVANEQLEKQISEMLSTF